MPELPEVETVVRELRAQVLNYRITHAELLRADLLKNLGCDATDFAAFFAGGTFISVERQGKYLLFTLDHGSRLLAHLGMTGKFIVAGEKDPPPKWLCSQYHFKGGLRLDHVDVRRFGRLEIHPKGADIPVLKRLGIDPLSKAFNAKALPTLVLSRAGNKRRTRAIHTLLLDQSLIAGVGNIYAAEALFRAGIRPTRQAGKITKAELERLAKSIQTVLKEAVKAGGTTISDYRRVDDKPGGFRIRLRVYSREGELCRICGKTVKRVVLGGRSAYYCPLCQK
jgi:formamidopyrimidine-DNA glycosylase